MRIKSIHFKINMAIIITAVVIAVIFGAILYPFEMRRYNAHVQKIHLLLDTVFQQKKEDIANEMFAGKKRALSLTLKEILKVEGISAVSVYLPDGDVFLATHDAFSERLTPRTRRSLSKGATFTTGVREHKSLGVYASAIEVIGRNIGFIQIYYDFYALDKETSLSVFIFVMLLLTTLLLMSGLMNLLLNRTVIRPVSLLREAINQVQEGRLGATVKLPSRDEIGEMGAAFNEMSLKLNESQMAIKIAEEKYRSIFENAIESLFQSTPGKGRYLTVNPSMVKTLGYDSQQDLIESVTDIAAQIYVDPSDRETLMELLHKKDRVVGYETRLYRKDRQIIWASVSVRNVYGDDGRLLYFEGSFADITQRRKMEKAEREREAAQAANKAKSVFLANMSHEIRTPLNAILGFADLLGSLVVDPEQQNYLASITSSGKSLLYIINDILDLSKIEAGKLEIRYEPTRISVLFNDIRKLFALPVQQKGLEFTTRVSPDLSEDLMLDEVRLRQVLFNLIGNAVKFTEKGSIALSAKKTDSTHEGYLDLTITVSDTGAGIHPEAQKEIFEAFRQQAEHQARSYEGTGLGLTISKSLIEMMGGTLSVTSRPGEGSIFEIRLKKIAPATDVSIVESDHSMEVDILAYPRASILVADDIALNRMLIKEFVRSSELTVIEAKDGRSAVQLARQHRPDLILMDIRMPVMDGYNAMAKIRRHGDLQSIPIVAITASGMKEELERIISSGFDGYLIRPFNRHQLIETVVRFLPREELKKSTPAPTMDPVDALSPQARNELPDIITRMEKDLMKQWESVRHIQRIPDIEDFGCRVKSLGEAHGMGAISEYGENLLYHVGGFDIDHIQSTLDRFPELIERIKKL